MGTERLEIVELTKRYKDVTALDGMSFDVRAGEMFGFVGGNGAGKTTTMRIALGVLEADAGEVRWAGKKVDLSVWRRIGYMPEERGLYPKMKVGDQLEYLGELHGMTRNDARRAVGEWMERLEVVGSANDELQKLSLGNQQRVQLAAALLHEPDILVLDEPFSGLDPIAVEVMSGVLLEQRDRGVPVLFSSHQLELVERLCDRVGIVYSGKMAACGTVDELRSTGDEQLFVELEGAGSGWADGFPGVRSSTQEGQSTVLQLDAGTDDQSLLRFAMQKGRLRHFSYERPTLSELFRDVISKQETLSSSEVVK